MIASKNLNDLKPAPKEKILALINAAKKELNIDTAITSTYRDKDYQNFLYAQGRTQAGKIVTNARGGESYHNYGFAADLFPTINGQALTDAQYSSFVAIAKRFGLTWGGNFSNIFDKPHFQLSDPAIASLIAIEKKKNNLSSSTPTTNIIFIAATAIIFYFILKKK